MQMSRLPRALLRVTQQVSPELSAAAKTRLQALEVWQATGDWQLATRVFGLSRATLFRWRHRYQPSTLSSLEARSRRPHRLRQPQTAPVVVSPLAAPAPAVSPLGARETSGFAPPRRADALGQDDRSGAAPAAPAGAPHRAAPAADLRP